MGFFDNIKNIRQRIDEIESSVYSGRQSLLEVYERNARLEEEIAQRSRELDRANKQMLTLHHIWEMMNSSKPLANVLNAIVNSLQGELGYFYSFIVKRMSDENGEFLQIVAHSNEEIKERFSNYFKCDVQDYRLCYPDSIPDLKKILADDGFYQSQDIGSFIQALIPEFEKERFENFIKTEKLKSYILIPLNYKQSRFGALVVFSARESVTENERNFLNLFARQIELAITIANLFQVVKEQAVTDGMTGLYNRRYFEDFIKKEAIRSDRQNQKFTVIGIDLDHLKQINDVYGHNYGDIAIKTIADILKNNARSIDIAARMGGEEFNLILPGVDSAGGCIAAERIRKAIAAVPLEKIGHITASLGVATYLEHSDDIDELLELTDQAMYQSKRNGRNRVSLAVPSNETSWQNIAINAFTDILTKHRIPIDEEFVNKLIQKIMHSSLGNERLYQVADSIVSTYNPEHSEGAAKQKVLFATLLAKRFDLSKADIDRLKIAILLYDIGNTMLPKEILAKKEPLTEEDKNSIKQHPIIAAREILKPISNVVDLIPIIEKHHENWNGSGYPNNLSGEEIPIESQIILIIDAYFALLEDRPYRQALSQADAILQIEKDINVKWNEKLAREFISIVQNDLN